MYSLKKSPPVYEIALHVRRRKIQWTELYMTKFNFEILDMKVANDLGSLHI
jgi:hypothetical protein